MTSASITPADRLSLTLFLAAVLHALVILGVGFSTFNPQAAREAPLIEITLAENPSAEAPKDYDYLAQANQDGGGQSEKRERPRKPSPALMPGVPEGDGVVDASPRPAPAPAPQAKRQQVVGSVKPSPDKASPQADNAPEQPDVSAIDLINASRQVAQSSAFQEDAPNVFAKFPNKRRIDARTKEHHAAAYMRSWIERIEEIGNQNYPDEARRRQLSGDLILEVTLRPDGSLHDVRVLRPSKYPALNEAAIRIVRLAAPFSPVPPEVLKGDDVLVITRTWEFVDQAGLSTR